MKKKLFTLLTLLLCLCSGAWADDTYTVSFTNSNWPQSTANYFTSVGTKNSPNSNYAGKYNGTTYDKGLKMEADTKVQFTTTRSFDITIVRSTKKNSGKTINFGTATGTKSALTFGSTLSDDNNADVAVSTLTNLDAGTYQIVRGDGETGIVYVSVTEKGDDTTLKLSVKGATSRSMIKGSESAIEVEAANASGSETYQWYRTNSSDTGCESGTAITGKTTTSYTPNEEEEGTYYYYCVVTDGDKTAKTSLITVAITAPRTGWVVFDGIVDTGLRATTVTYNNVSMTYATSASGVTDVSGKTNNTTGRPYQKGISLAKSTDNGEGGYLSFTIPTGYKATSFTWAFSGTGGRTIILASAKINSTSAEGYITTLASVSGSNHIVGGTYTTELAAGTYYIRECNGGGWQIDELAFTLTETNDPPAAIIFDPATGSSVEAESEITLASAGATTIKYQWGSSVVDGEGDWSSAETYSEENKPEVPAYGSSNIILSVKASNTHGDTYGSATYTITAPTYTITYAANGGSGTMTETKVVDGEDQTLPDNTFTRDCYAFSHWTADVDVTVGGNTVTAGNAIADEATIQDVTSDITLTAQWTPVYASGSYVFENNATVGTNPSKTVTTTKTSYDPFQIDNLYFSNMAIEYEEGVYSGSGDDFKGWKIKTKDATIKFMVENDMVVTIGVGNLTSAANVSYTALDGTVKNNVALTAKSDNVHTVKGGTLVTITTEDVSTVTLKKIAIENIAVPTDPTEEGVTVTLTTSDNMAGWRSFYPAGQGYTLDANTKAFVVTAAPAENKVTLVTLAEGGQDIPGNTPVILKTSSAADSHKMTLTKKDGVANYAGDENKLKVTAGGEDLSAGVCRLGYGTTGLGFYGYAVASAPAGIIYLDAAPAAVAGKGYTLVFEGETTGIANLNVDDNANIDANAPMYNLAGQRVNKSYKGVVIVNGKKMLNK